MIFAVKKQNKIDKKNSCFQYKIKKCMAMLEDCTRMVSLANIFSSNEHVDEIATTNVKYFLLPVLLAYLSLKITHGDRLELIQMADIYFRDFLKRCKEYSITDIEVEDEKEDEGSSTSSLESMVPFNRPPFDIGKTIFCSFSHLKIYGAEIHNGLS